MLIELTASLAQPSLAALGPGDDGLPVKLDLHLGSLCLAGRLGLRAPVLGAVTLELALGLCQGSTTPLAGPQVLGQLIATRIPVELVLGRVEIGGLLEDLPGELLVVEV